MRHRPFLRRAQIVLSLVSVLFLAGCANYVGKQIVRAPNLDRPTGIFSEEMEAAWEAKVANHFFVERSQVTPPGSEIDLHVALLPAGDYPNRLAIERNGDKVSVSFNADLPFGPPPAPARGTIIGIHGWQTEHRALLYHAMELAGEDWDVVLYDQRGHGRSGGEFVSFGMREAQDLEAVIEWTRNREQYTPPLILFGVSMGASTALLAAAESGPDAIIAVAPFARLDTVLPRALQRLSPFYIRPFLTASRIEKALAHARVLSGVALTEVAPIARAAEVSAPVLLIYSEADQLVPVEHAHQLHDALPNATLKQVEDASHEILLIDRDLVLDLAVPWLKEVLDRGNEMQDRSRQRPAE